MAWTHIYDLFMKLASMVLAIFIINSLPFMHDYGITFFITIVVLFFVLYYFFFRTVATLLYSKYMLHMNLTWAQATTLNDAFSPLFPLKWLPLNYIKDIKSQDAKYPAALSALTQWQMEKKRISDSKKTDFKNARQSTQALTVLMVVLVGYFLVASFLNMPPANFITAAYCKMFNTENYYPMLNAIILIVPTYLIFKLIDKDIK